MTSEERAKTLCSLMRGYGTPLTSLDDELIAKAIKAGEDAARAAGFAEALSLAAEEASKWADGFHIAKAIRALAPAKTP